MGHANWCCCITDLSFPRWKNRMALYLLKALEGRNQASYLAEYLLKSLPIWFTTLWLNNPKLHPVMQASERNCTWNTRPSTSAKAFTACSGIMYVMKANPLGFLVRLSIGKWISDRGPAIKRQDFSVTCHCSEITLTLQNRDLRWHPPYKANGWREAWVPEHQVQKNMYTGQSWLC